MTGSRVGQWEEGEPLRPDQVFELEAALGLEPGSLSHLLGYVPVERGTMSVLAAIAQARELDEYGREMVEVAYRAARRQSEARSRRTSAKNSRPV